MSDMNEPNATLRGAARANRNRPIHDKAQRQRASDDMQHSERVRKGETPLTRSRIKRLRQISTTKPHDGGDAGVFHDRMVAYG